MFAYQLINWSLHYTLLYTICRFLSGNFWLSFRLLWWISFATPKQTTFKISCCSLSPDGYVLFQDLVCDLSPHVRWGHNFTKYIVSLRLLNFIPWHLILYYICNKWQASFPHVVFVGSLMVLALLLHSSVRLALVVSRIVKGIPIVIGSTLIAFFSNSHRVLVIHVRFMFLGS